MRKWRKATPGEKLSALVVAGAFWAMVAIAKVWLNWGLPLPQCRFRQLTGYPCPTCGGTTAVKALLDGKVAAALAANPLVAAGAMIFMATASLAPLWAAVGGPIPAKMPKPRKVLTLSFSLLLLLLLLNWAYLITSTKILGHG